ncbi:hypothetical protein ACWGLF_30860 [Streptomyces puniciscabiei]
MATGLSEASVAWLDDTADTLAAALQGSADVAKAAGIDVWFSNPRSDFAGKGVCGDPEQVHGIVKTLTESDEPIKDGPLINQYGLSAQWLHPEIGGARLYANALGRTMAGMSL